MRGRYPHAAKACACGRILARQRPLTLRSKVVTTKMQLGINVERLLLNRGCLTAPAATLTLRARQASKSERIPTSTIRVKPRFASGGRTAIGRAAAIRVGRIPKFRLSLLHLCGRSRRNESFNQCWPLRSCLGRRRSRALKAS
jgi:hypothetical protein